MLSAFSIGKKITCSVAGDDQIAVAMEFASIMKQLLRLGVLTADQIARMADMLNDGGISNDEC